MLSTTRNLRHGQTEGSDQQTRLTATEVIADVLCRITLERDATGHYREIMWTPVPNPIALRR